MEDGRTLWRLPLVGEAVFIRRCTRKYLTVVALSWKPRLKGSGCRASFGGLLRGCRGFYSKQGIPHPYFFNPGIPPRAGAIRTARKIDSATASAAATPRASMGAVALPT